jgi:hypothetical protein
MNLKMIMGAALAGVVFATAAQAATITNNEAKPMSFKVQSGEKQQAFTLNPSDTVAIDDALCPESCVLALQNGDEFEFAFNEDLVLEQGAVYVNPPSQGGAGDQGQPQPQQQ